MVVGFIAVTIIEGAIGYFLFHTDKEDDPKEGESAGGGCITALLFGAVIAAIMFGIKALENL